MSYPFTIAKGHSFAPAWAGEAIAGVIQPYANGDSKAFVLRVGNSSTEGWKVFMDSAGNTSVISRAYRGTLRKAYHLPNSANFDPSDTYGGGGSPLTPYNSGSGLRWVYYNLTNATTYNVRWTIPVGSPAIGMDHFVLETYVEASTGTANCELWLSGSKVGTIINANGSYSESSYACVDWDLGRPLVATDTLEVRRGTGYGVRAMGGYCYDSSATPTDSDEEWDLSYPSHTGTNPIVCDLQRVMNSKIAAEYAFKIGSSVDDSNHRWIGGYNHSTGVSDNCSSSDITETVAGAAPDREDVWGGTGKDNSVELIRDVTWTNDGISTEMGDAVETYNVNGSYIEYYGKFTATNDFRASYLYFMEMSSPDPDWATYRVINRMEKKSLTANLEGRSDCWQVAYYSKEEDIAVVGEFEVWLPLEMRGVGTTTGDTYKILPYYEYGGSDSVEVSSGDEWHWRWRWWVEAGDPSNGSGSGSLHHGSEGIA